MNYAGSDNSAVLDRLFNGLRKLKQTGDYTWQACCPAHDDRSPSFQVKVSDGRILLHCFAGCEKEDICASVGIELSDLFPDKGHYRPVSRPANIPTEDAYFIAVIKSQIKRGEAIPPMDISRYRQAVLREAAR